MTIFVDASVLVAILAEENDADMLVARLGRDPDLRTAALAIWEAAVGLTRLLQVTPQQALTRVRNFLDETRIAVEPIDSRTAALALDAFERFGKGRHSAGLNMGDCFAYAGAKTIGGALLYKGDDFSKTDLATTV